LLQVLQPFWEKISEAEFTKFVGNSGGMFGRLLAMGMGLQLEVLATQ